MGRYGLTSIYSEIFSTSLLNFAAHVALCASRMAFKFPRLNFKQQFTDLLIAHCLRKPTHGPGTGWRAYAANTHPIQLPLVPLNAKLPMLHLRNNRQLTPGGFGFRPSRERTGSSGFILYIPYLLS